MKVVPMSLKEANNFVLNFHRHNKPVQGAKFAIGASDGEKLIGVAIVGRPVSRHLDNGYTAEVTRCCVLENAPKNACSFLYSKCWRIWCAMGGEKLITYTLQSESGASLRGAGWKIVGKTLGVSDGKGWTNRPGREWQPITGQEKFRWEFFKEKNT
jgi:hypothetical protein